MDKPLIYYNNKLKPLKKIEAIGAMVVKNGKLTNVLSRVKCKEIIRQTKTFIRKLEFMTDYFELDMSSEDSSLEFLGQNPTSEDILKRLYESVDLFEEFYPNISIEVDNEYIDDVTEITIREF